MLLSVILATQVDLGRSTTLAGSVFRESRRGARPVDRPFRSGSH